MEEMKENTDKPVKYAIEVEDLKIRYTTLNKMSIKKSLTSFRKAKKET